MRAAFPYMGSIHLVLAPILRSLGASVVVPPPPDRRVLDIGVRLAPELMCIPFKITLGNMVRSLELGADTLVYVGGSWSCRFGYYGRLQTEILRDHGYRFRVIELRHDNLKAVAQEIVRLNSGSWAKALVRAARALRLGWFKSAAVEAAEAWCRRTMPVAQDPGACRGLLSKSLKQIERAETPAELARLRTAFAGRFAALPRNGAVRVPRVKLVGESYCTIEPFVNFDICQRMGEMGVEVEPFLTGHQWLGFHGFRFGKTELQRAKQAASRYWRDCVGGEDQSSLGHLMLAAEQGFDGVVHVHPFGCMPGTVVQPAMARASQDLDIPFLSLSLDEHTSEAGLLIRVEAFVSLLKRRRARRSGPRTSVSRTPR